MRIKSIRQMAHNDDARTTRRSLFHAPASQPHHQPRRIGTEIMHFGMFIYVGIVDVVQWVR